MKDTKRFAGLIVRPLAAFATLMVLMSSSEAGSLDRTVLPIAEPQRPTYTELDVRKVTPPPHFEVKAPDGAPNILVVLVDDLGFAGTSAFGGPVGTPTFDR